MKTDISGPDLELLIMGNRTPKGGWTMAQLKALGIDWPPVVGWRKRLCDIGITHERAQAFLGISQPFHGFAVADNRLYLYNTDGYDLSVIDRVTIHTDGSSKSPAGNPGGWAAVLRYKGVDKEISGGFIETTNNRCEIYAVVKALETLTRPCHVLVVTDSEITIAAFRTIYHPRKRLSNQDLRDRGAMAKESHLSFEIRWTKGHTGVADNERADVLAGQARLNVERHIIDAGYDPALVCRNPKKLIDKLSEESRLVLP